MRVKSLMSLKVWWYQRNRLAYDDQQAREVVVGYVGAVSCLTCLLGWLAYQLICLLGWLVCWLVSCLLSGLLGLRKSRQHHSFAKLASLAQTMVGLLDLLGLLNLRRLRQAQLLAKLAPLAQTMLGLLDLRKLRFTRSLVEPVSLAYAHQSKFAKMTFFCENPNLRTKGFLLKNYFYYDFLKTILTGGF